MVKGKAIPWTDEEIEEFSEIRLSDIEDSKSAWRKDAEPEFKTLLDARVEDEDSATDDGSAGDNPGSGSAGV